MTGTIAITDTGWYEFLLGQGELDEVNFWTPSARRAFRAPQYACFLFKLKAPHNAICGFGFFARHSRLPDWLAWDCFGEANGCRSLSEMRDRIGAIRERIRYRGDEGSLQEIGCILVVRPTFFPREAWIPQPSDWPVRTQTSKGYDLTQGEGARVWQTCLANANALWPDVPGAESLPPAAKGAPRIVEPRLGQGTFRVAVMEAYGRSCAVTEEHSLPALEAAHIRPVSEDGPNDVRNGMFLRADIHHLFDKGYVTVTPELRIEVSGRLREDFRNGHTYYPMRGHEVHVPGEEREKPAKEFLVWHNEKVFL